VFSVILFISILKGAALLAHLFLTVIRSRVKDVRGDVTDIVEKYEVKRGTDGGISRRVLMLCDE